MQEAGVCIVKIRLSDMTLIEYNDAMCEGIGYTRKEYERLFHHDMKQYFSGEYKKELTHLRRKAADAFAQGEQCFSINMRVPTKKGEIWINGSALFTAYSKRTGRPSVLATIYHDITDAISTQQELAKMAVEQAETESYIRENARLQNLIDSVPAGLSAFRIKQGVFDELQLNRYFLDEIVLPHVKNRRISLAKSLVCIHPDDRERCRQDFYQLLRRKKTATGQYRFHVRQDNGYHWFSVHGNVTKEPSGDQIVYFTYTDIDALMKAELELEERRRMYSTAVKTAQLMIFEYDIPHHRLIMSDDPTTQAECRKFHVPNIVENIPESLQEFVEENDYQKLVRMYRKVKQGQNASCEVWYKQMAEVEPRCERVTYTVLKDEAGKIRKAYAIGQNITAERKVEERYVREMNYMRHANDDHLLAKGHYNLTKNKVLSYITGNNDNVYHVKQGITYDEAYEGMLVFPYEEKERRKIENALKRENLIARYKKGEMQTTIQYHRTVNNHDTLWLSLTVHTYMMPDTGDLEMFSYVYDISEKMIDDLVMEKISQSEFDYIGVLYSKTEEFMVLKKTAGFQLVEPRVKVPYQELCDQTRKNFISNDELNQYDEVVSVKNIIRGLKKKEHYMATYLLQENRNTYCKQLSYEWLNRKLGTILVVRSDVTVSYLRDQKRLKEIENEKLRADQASELKTVFLSSMSHDIRTPLNGVLGFTEIALRQDDLTATREYLKKIRSSGTLLLDLVNDTLDLSRIDSGKEELYPESVNHKELLEEVITAMRPSADLKKIDLQVDLSRLGNGVIWIDKLKAQKIVLNLLSNSIKYTPEGGKVVLKCQALNPPINGMTYRLTISDNGIGMSKEFLQKLYEPFAQEKRPEASNVTGTGLGMTMVKRMVDLMGGRIEVTSKIKKGTTYQVDLPLRMVKESVTEIESAKLIANQLAGKHVLLCEDNQINAEIASIQLKDKGMRVDVAHDGHEAVYRFKNAPAGTYDLILMDVQMPVMDGLEATRRIRRLNRQDAKRIPIIAMTGNTFQDDINNCRKAGMNGHIAKPIDPKKMFEIICDIINSNQ